MRTQAQSMHIHTISLRAQANVYARILMPRNPNLSFSTSVSLFLSYHMLMFHPFLMLSKSLVLWLVVYLSLTC